MKRRRKIIAKITAMIMIVLSIFSTVAFADNTKEIVDQQVFEFYLVPGEDGTLKPMNLTPEMPYILRMNLEDSYTTEGIKFEGGNKIAVSASATDLDGNTILGAFVKVMLLEIETGNIPLDLRIDVDGNNHTETAYITNGENYRFACMVNTPYKDEIFKFKLAAVLYNV